MVATSGSFKPMSMEEIKSRKYGKLTVISEAEPVVYTYRKGFHKPTTMVARYMNCRCDCGNKCIKKLIELTGGRITHCGCVKKVMSDENKMEASLRMRALAEAKRMEKEDKAVRKNKKNNHI